MWLFSVNRTFKLEYLYRFGRRFQTGGRVALSNVLVVRRHIRFQTRRVGLRRGSQARFV